MTSDTVLALAPGSLDLEAFMGGSVRLSAFDPSRRDTLAALSAAMLRDPQIRADPAGVALAFWLRRANIEVLHTMFKNQTGLNDEVIHVPVGRVFHITPANVDTLFMYSWALAYLCGNTSLIRLSGERSTLVEAILRLLNEMMADDEIGADLRHSNAFITYPHDDALTGRFSMWCNHRVIWGGNNTINHLRLLPLSPHASERTFATKFSYTVIAADAYTAASEEERAQLAGQFYNDMFWFDQMACSSPHVVFWVGGARHDVAFDNALAAVATAKNYEVLASSAVKRLNYAFELASEATVTVDLHREALISIAMTHTDQVVKDICGGGLLRHVQVATLDEVARFASYEDQTITTFGFPQYTLLALAQSAHGVDRIVPVGQALNFDVVWDGYDLIGDMTKRVVVRAT